MHPQSFGLSRNGPQELCVVRVKWQHYTCSIFSIISPNVFQFDGCLSMFFLFSCLGHAECYSFIILSLKNLRTEPVWASSNTSRGHYRWNWDFYLASQPSQWTHVSYLLRHAEKHNDNKRGKQKCLRALLHYIKWSSYSCTVLFPNFNHCISMLFL